MYFIFTDGCHRLPAFAKVVSVDKIDGGSCTEGSQCTKTASTKSMYSI